MKALILNSGKGSRMGNYTADKPKCMVPLANGETILERQLRQLQDTGIREVIITTGAFDLKIREFAESLSLTIPIKYVCNPLFDETNYIYSIYLARAILDTDLLLLHGDLVFDPAILQKMLLCRDSCMAVDGSALLQEKDFKAVMKDGRIAEIGVDLFENAVAAWPLYMLKKEDLYIWLDKISQFCEEGNRTCYAEHAFNCVSDQICLFPFYLDGLWCSEIDTEQDLMYVRKMLCRG